MSTPSAPSAPVSATPKPAATAPGSSVSTAACTPPPMPTSRAEFIKHLWAIASGAIQATPAQLRALDMFAKFNGWNKPPESTATPAPYDTEAARAELYRVCGVTPPAGAASSQPRCDGSQVPDKDFHTGAKPYTARTGLRVASTIPPGQTTRCPASPAPARRAA